MGMCMTQQHTGKKRRKEVREAIDLQHMVKTTTIALVIIFVAGLARVLLRHTHPHIAVSINLLRRV